MLTRRDLIVRSLSAAVIVLGRGGLAAVQAYADPVPIPPDAPWEARHNLSADDYQATFERLAGQGYRLVDVSGYEMNGEAHYAAIWAKFTGPAMIARHGLSASDYQALFDTLPGQGFRPIHVSAYTVGGIPLFASIWLQDNTEWVVRHGLSNDDYQSAFDDFGSQGYRLIDVSGYDDGGQARYAAIWDKSSGPGWVAHHGLTADDHQALFDQLTGQGFRPIRVNGYGVAGTDYYASIWLQMSGPAWVARHAVLNSDYERIFDDWTYRGFRPLQVSGYSGRGFSRMAAIFENHGFSDADLATMDGIIDDFMKKWSAPGLSLAISKDERLLYARGVGSLDNGGNTPTSVTSVFRVVSVTKPFTATAIFRLIEQQKLKLTDTVFGASGILGTTYGTTPYGTNIEKITVQHLLEHTAGGWMNDGNDPMFAHPDYDHAKLIGWVLDNRPLDNAPGTNYAYSNFGYCLLGRVIEKVSGFPYDAYVKAAVLEPSGISDMNIAANGISSKRPDEAFYYDQSGADPYGFNIARMDSHGGWLASALDLTRFAVHVDGFPRKSDVVSSTSLTSMTTPSAAKSDWGKGWALYTAGGENNWFIFGYLPGSTSLLARYSNGFCCAAIVNLSQSQDPNFPNGPDTQLQRDLDQMLRDLRTKVTSWPTYDLF
ncbi:MAG: serine hydrolase [Chloroflexi bacterium]|nr:serine hydrolase [Chloroflexota bacterium]